MNIFKQLIKSLYSPKDIAKFRYQKIGKTIAYVFLLMFLSVLPGIYHFTMFTGELINDAKAIFAEDIPSFTISNGTLTADVNEPMKFTGNDMPIYFDPTGTMKAEDIESKNNAMGLLKDELIIVTDGRTAQTFSYTTFGDINITNETITTFLDTAADARWIILPIFFLLFYLFTAGIGFIKVSLFALVAVFIAKLLQRKLVYRHGWRLTAYSITLPTIFFSIMQMLQVQLAFQMLLDWMITLIIIYLSIREMPKPKKR